MPPAEAVDYMLQAAKPLAQMHDAGIVHRDVKPSNIFLARDAEGNERLKLLDFGVAAFQQPLARGESSITLTDAIIGTPRYMAPEQVRASKEVDARADVWALGVTLYELLAGSPPFDGQTVLAVLNQIEQQEPPLLSARQPRVTTELAAVVHRCLAKDPALRPADARALAEALAPFAKQSSRAAERARAAPERPGRPIAERRERGGRSAGAAIDTARAPLDAPRTTRAHRRGRRRCDRVRRDRRFALHGREKTPTPDEVKTNPESSPAALVAETLRLGYRRRAVLRELPSPRDDGADSRRRHGSPGRRARAPRRRAQKSGKASPHPATNKAARSPAEDDDRIE